MQNNQEKLISIILPTYNGEKYIRRSIQSVINQSYSSWELLIVDDGSSDNTADIAKKYTEKDSRIIYIKNENNLGIQKTLNSGIKEAKGEYIARIDDDDIWIDADKLKKQIEFLENNKDYVLVGTGAVLVDGNGKELVKYMPPQSDNKIREKFLITNCFVHSAVCFSKKAVIAIGGYSESAETRHVEDYDLWLRLGIIGKMENLDTLSVQLTIHNDSISGKNKIEQFKKIKFLLLKNRKNYPNFLKGYFNRLKHIFLYGILIKILGQGFFKRLLVLYKKYQQLF